MNILAQFWSQRTPGQRMMLLAVAILVFALLGLWISRGLFSEEERVKSAVLELINACEKRDIQKFSGMVSRDYRGWYMTDYDSLVKRVEENFARYSSLSVSVTQWDLQMGGGPHSASPKSSSVGAGAGADETIVRIHFRFRMFVNSAGPYRNFPVNHLPATPRGEDDQARLVLKNESGQWKLIESEFAAPE